MNRNQLPRHRAARQLRMPRISIGLAAVAALLVPTTVSAGTDNPLPSCAEDDIIVGTGDYAHRRWTGYACGHPDTLAASYTDNARKPGLDIDRYPNGRVHVEINSVSVGRKSANGGWRVDFGAGWSPVPHRLVGETVDDLRGSGSFRITRHCVWNVGGTTIIIRPDGRVGTS